MRFAFAAVLLIAAACSRPGVHHPLADPHLTDEIAAIKAIDNHAHIVSIAANDREFDALPVDNLEPSVLPSRLTDPKAPEQVQARNALFGRSSKADVMKQKGDAYASWVLDQAGIETALANRVRMTPDLTAPRFRWTSYVDSLLFPLDNTSMVKDSDKAAFFKLEEGHRKRYLTDAGLSAVPSTLDEYTSKVVTPTLEKQKQAGVLGLKYEAAYLRALDFSNAAKDDAARVYSKYPSGAVPPAEYKILQDYLFCYIAKEAGRLGLAIHIHTGFGGGGYFNTTGSDPILLEPVLNDPAFRKTNFVLLHGAWPFGDHLAALITKPNVYADVSVEGLFFYPTEMAKHIRGWLEFAPEKVLFGTDAYPWSDQFGWEEAIYMSATTTRQALAIALTGMWKDGEVTHPQALDIARLVLRDNARKLYKLP